MKMSDGTIRKLLNDGTINIDPAPADSQFQPCSVDLTLSTSFCWPEVYGRKSASVAMEEMVLPSGGFVLASTKERVTLPSTFMAEVHGKSTWARRGLMVHAAGLVDPGFNGTLTLEVFNMSRHPLPLFAGMPICQITFERVDWPVVRGYGSEGLSSHYQNQEGATSAR